MILPVYLAADKNPKNIKFGYFLDRKFLIDINSLWQVRKFVLRFEDFLYLNFC